MASSGKGKRKVKGKTVALNSFLGDQNAPTGYAVVAPRMDWADSVEEEEKYSYPKEEVLILPTAPKAARGPDVDLSKVPSQPPFTAFVGNLPYDISEDDITRFFGNLKVVSVRLPRDGGDRGRMRGFGYAEFEDKQSLIEALALHGETLKNRPIKVSLAGEHENEKDRKNDGPDRTAGDWRAAPREDSFASRNDRQRNGTYGSKYDDDRDSFKSRNGYDNDRDSHRGRSGFDDNRYRDDDRPSYQGRKSYERERDRDYGFGRDRDRDRYSRDGDSFSDRDRDRGYNRDRGGYNRGFDSYDRDNRDSDRGSNRRYGGGGGFDDRNRSYGGRSRRDEDVDSRRDDDREKEAPKERPRLQLKPRTVPVEQPAAAPAPSPAAGSSIFGGAKPVNTAAREREIEMRLAKEKEKLSESERPKFSQSNRYGDSRIPSDDRESSFKRDRDQKYSETRDSRDSRGRDSNSPRRRYNDEPLKEKNSRDYREEADYSEHKSLNDEPKYQTEQGYPRESRSRNTKGGSHPGLEQENDEPENFLSNKFSQLLLDREEFE